MDPVTWGSRLNADVPCDESVAAGSPRSNIPSTQREAGRWVCLQAAPWAC